MSPKSKCCKKSKSKCCKKTPLVGSTTVGERGQIVIPKNIRDGLNLEPGTPLLVMKHRDSIMLLPVERMQSMIQDMTKQLDKIQPQKK